VGEARLFGTVVPSRIIWKGGRIKLPIIYQICGASGRVGVNRRRGEVQDNALILKLNMIGDDR
jgi:hypothetical protein